MKPRATPPLAGALLLAALVTAPPPVAALVTGPPPAAALVTGLLPATAQEPALPAEAAARAELRVFLLTFGPGAQVWERFGHNALWIHDPEAGTDVAYHYGLFDMSESGFLLRFLQGRMLYSMGEADALLLLDAYRRAGRDATVQELRVTQEQARELQAFLEWNLRPDNRVYRYDYFRDNCSTRIRDALDRVLNGALASQLRTRRTAITYRREALALTAEDELLAAGMDLGLGPLADQPITRWELAFIPMRLRDDLRDLRVSRDGERVPLVADERRFPAVSGPDESLAVPPGRVDGRVVGLLLLGLAGAALFVTLGWLARQRADAGPARKVARWALAVGGALWGLIAGVLGVILLALWLLTDHEFAHANENLLQANPLGLALVVLVPVAVRRGGSTAAFYTAAALTGLSALGLVIHPLPLTPQANLGIIALALPVHLGLLHALAGRRPAGQRPAGRGPAGQRPGGRPAGQRPAEQRAAERPAGQRPAPERERP